MIHTSLAFAAASFRLNMKMRFTDALHRSPLLAPSTQALYFAINHSLSINHFWQLMDTVLDLLALLGLHVGEAQDLY